jgi:hypothetical protein
VGGAGAHVVGALGRARKGGARLVGGRSAAKLPPAAGGGGGLRWQAARQEEEEERRRRRKKMTTGSTHAREGIRLWCFDRGARVRCFRVGWGGGS